MTTETATLQIKVTDSGIDAVGHKLTTLGKISKATEAATARLSETKRNLTATTSNLGARVKDATQKLTANRQVTQNVGYQLQDFTVQVGNGTSALTAFAQQGSQLASLMGPQGALIGAAIAIGGTLGASLLPSLFDSESATERLDAALESLEDTLTTTKQGVSVLTAEFITMARESSDVAKIQLENRLVQALDAVQIAIEGVSQSAEDLDITNVGRGGRARVLSLANAYDITKNQASGLVRILKEFESDPTVESVGNLQKALNDLVLTGGDSNQKLLTLAQRVNESAADFNTAQEAVDFFKETLADLDGTLEASNKKVNDQITALKFEAETLGFSDRVLALHIAYKNEATEAQLRAINSEYDIIEAYEKSQQALKDQNAEIKAKAVARAAEDEANKRALEGVRRANRTREEALNESFAKQRKIILDNTESNSEAQRSLLEGLNKRYATDILDGFGHKNDSIDAKIAKINDEHKARRDAILANVELTETQREALEIELTQRRTNAIEELETKRNQMILASSSQMFDGLAGLAKTFGGEQSKSYKVLFAASKAFAVAESSIAIQQAMAKAISLGWPANIPAISETLQLTSGILSTINSINYAGAFDKGGMIPAGKFGIVGEYGPEFVQGPAKVTGRQETAAILQSQQQPPVNVAAPQVKPTIVNVLDPALVGDYLATDAGEELIMNIVQRNQS